ncbi:MAG: recombination regulator RecX [Clostridiales Family XIII bacterium]|jgi:regulatory protein|nr:recombination regulator RecX [Clostridiales Family XIII bacterium]
MKSKVSAIEKAYDYLSRRAHTEYEIRLKLRKKEYAEDEIDGAVAQLLLDGYIDDRDFAERYLRVLIEKGRGKRRIKDEMRRKGIAEELAVATIEACMSEEDERANALRYAEKILEKMDCHASLAMTEVDGGTGGSGAGMTEGGGMTNEVKRKVNSKMVEQGYPYDTINWTLRELEGRIF